MKLAVLTAALLLMVGMTAAVEGYNGSKDQPHIMTGPGESNSSNASEPSPADPEWEVNVKQKASTCKSGGRSAGISDVSYSGEEAVNGTKKISFTGRIDTANPCHEINYDVVKQDGRYLLNITTEATGDACIQCVGMIEYEASFSTDEAFQLEVMHDGETADTLSYPGYEGGNSDDESAGDPDNSSGKGPKKKGFLQSISSWFSSLF